MVTMITRPTAISDLNTFRQPQTTLEMYAEQVGETDQRFGAVFANDAKLSVADAFYHIGGDDIVLDVVPLAGVDPADNTKVILGADKVKERYIRQTAPFESYLGMVRTKDGVLPHKDFVALLDRGVEFNGKKLSPSAMAITRDGKKIAVQFPLNTIDIHGDAIRQHVMIYSSVIRSAGSGVMLWDMVMRCSNQIPVMRMGRGDKNLVSIGGRSPLRIETMMGSFGNFMQNAQEKMRDAYHRMVATPITPNMMEAFLGKIYAVPEIPKPKIYETLDEKMAAMNQWSLVYNKALADRNAVKEIFDNGNGTHDTRAVQGNMYGFIQAVTELETKRPFRDAAIPLNQYLGNSGRGKKSVQAFDLAYDAALRHTSKR